MNCTLILIWLNIFSLLLSACVSQVDTATFNKQQAAKARVELGLGYLAQRQFTQAKLNFDKALAYAPNYYLVHSALAYFYQEQGAFQLANQAYLAALNLAPQQSDVLNNYGVFLCKQAKFEQAYTQFNHALATANYYQQADTYENIILCAFSAKDSERYQQNLQLLAQIDASRAQKLLRLFALN
ncbi:type IV pilus biogenesis/stability protein PilW [Pasteurella oralis]|uniref:type IV pilus biogenesis/stability protein PilW n=1 Tax=Pasteurella oralis TaxID=1071947 RepID=UPI000C7B86F9|nr:type IV pilus biogenesis/stability protein PilW [Pasteurella oralis]